MKITCDVIKDLLPLYTEGMASADTAVLVEAHLASCEACQKALKDLRTPVTISADTDAVPLRKVQKTMKNKKTRTVVFTALICLVVAITAFGWLTAPEYLPFTSDTVSVTAQENGLLTMRFHRHVSGYDVYSAPAETGGGTVCHITAWDSIWDRLFSHRINGEIVLNPDRETVIAVYYYQADETEDHLVYGEDVYNIVTLPRLFLSYYLTAALVLAVLLLAAALILRKHRKAYKALLYTALAPVSYLLAHLCVKGVNTMTYAPIRDLSLILLAAMPIYGVLFMLLRRRLKRRDTPCD